MVTLSWVWAWGLGIVGVLFPAQLHRWGRRFPGGHATPGQIRFSAIVWLGVLAAIRCFDW